MATPARLATKAHDLKSAVILDNSYAVPKKSQLSTSLALATRCAVAMPIFLGALSVQEAAAFDNFMEQFASNGELVFNSNTPNDTSSTGTKYLKHKLSAGDHEWNATVTFTGNHDISAISDKKDEGKGLNYHGTGKLIVDMDDRKNPVNNKDAYELSFDASNLGQGKNLDLKVSLDTIEIKNGYLNFNSKGNNSIIDAKKIIVGSDDTRNVAYLGLANPQSFTLGNQKTELHLGAKGTIQTPGEGKSLIAGQIIGNGGTIYVFNDKTSTKPTTPGAGGGAGGTIKNTGTVTPGTGTGSGTGSVPSAPVINYPNASKDQFNMQLWNDSAEGTHFNLKLAHGSTTLFSIADDPTTYHHNEGLLHVSSGTITLQVAQAENNNTAFEIASGTLWMEDAVKIEVDDSSADKKGTNSTQVIISSGGILKHSYNKLKDFIGLNGQVAPLGTNTDNVTSQLVFNGGTLWFTDEGEFDLADNFQAVTHIGGNNKSPIIINDHVNGDTSKDKIHSNIYVKNSWLKRSLNNGKDQVQSVDIGQLHLITNNLALSRADDDDQIITLGNSTISVIEQITNKHGDELMIRTGEVTSDKAIFNLDNDAFSVIDEHADIPIDNLKVDIKDLTLGHGVQFNVKAGNWSAYDLTLQSGASLSVGNADEVRGAVLDQSSNKLTLDNGANTVTIHADGSLKIGALDLSHTDSATINVKGKLEVTGDVSLIDDCDWYYKTSANDQINVSGELAQITFDNKVLSNITFDQDNKIDFGNCTSTFTDTIKLTDGATLKFDFSDQRSFTIDQVQNLMQAVLAPHDNHDESIIDLGNAQIDAIAGIVDSNGEVSIDELTKLHNKYHVLEHLKVANLKGATVTGINSSTKVDGHAGALKLSSGTDTANVGGGSLNAAVDGKFVFEEGTNELGSLNIAAGKRFRLNDGGAVKDVNLKTGSYLVVNSNDGVTNLKSVKGEAGLTAFNSGKINVAEDVDVGTFITAAGSDTHVAGDVYATTAWFGGDLQVDGKTVLGSDAFLHAYVYNGATVETNELELMNETILAVGMGRLTAQHFLTDPTAEASTGTLVTNKLVLSSGTLIADPDYGQKASMVVAKELATLKGVKNYMDGNIVAAQNSIIMVGSDASIELGQKLFDRYIDDNTGSLIEDKAGSIVYFGDSNTMDNSYRLILDPEEESYEIMGDEGALNGLIHQDASTGNRYSEESPNFNGGKSTQADIYLGDHTVLAIGANVNGTAIQLDKDQGTIMAAGDNAKIVVFGSKSTNRELVLFKDNDGNGIHVLGHHDILVESANGLYSYTYKHAQDTGTDPIILKRDPNKDLGKVFDEASDPGLDFIADIIDKDLDNDYLGDVVGDGNGKELEDVGRIHAFGGIVSAAINTVEASADAIGTHIGEFITNENQLGSRLWVQALHRNSDSSDLAAQGISYGNTLNLNGASLGIDNRDFANTLFGAAVHIGAGKVTGEQTARFAQNEFDYYGASLYGAYRAGSLDVFGDVTYVHTNNELETKNLITKVKSDVDTQAYSIGFQAGYRFDMFEEPSSKFALRPYAGLRYSHISLDDANVSSDKHGKVGNASVDDLSLITLPFGTQFIYEQNDSNWKTKLSLDLGAKVNLGDDEIGSTTVFTNIEEMKYQTSTEINSAITYGAKVNVTASTDSWSFHGNIGYNRSADGNFDELSLNTVVSLRF